MIVRLGKRTTEHTFLYNLTHYTVSMPWNDVELHSTALLGAEHQDEDVWEIMKPSDFSTFTVPFAMEGDTRVWLILIKIIN